MSGDYRDHVPEHVLRGLLDKVAPKLAAEHDDERADETNDENDTRATRPAGSRDAIPDPPSRTLEHGTRLGRYTLLDKIDEGTFGEVRKAWDPRLNRVIAVKILKPNKIAEGERFVREAKLLAQLNHPNIVQIYDVGDDEPELFIAMELVDGETLRSYSARLDAEQARGSRACWRPKLDAYMDAGRGLAFAHEQKVVHRDFKPDNVLVGREDRRVRVVDFGLARASADVDPAEAAAAEAGASPSMSAIGQKLTRTGGRPGSPFYMALEVHDGKQADAASDQFSFCVALFRSLYGADPFAGKTEAALREAKARGVVHAPTRGAPAWLWRVLVRGLRPDPAERYPSMNELLVALGKDPRRLVLRALAIVGAILIAFMGGWLWQEREERHARVVEAEKQQTAEQEQRAAEEHANAERSRREMIEREDRLTMRFVEDDLLRDPTRAVADLKELSASADAWNGVVRMIAADAMQRGIARHELRLPPDEVAHGLSPDGGTVVTRNPTSGEVRLLDIATQEVRILATTDAILPVVAFSPDGKRLAALRLSGGVGVWDLDDLEHRPLGDSPDAHNDVPFSADGTKLLTYGRHPEVHVWDLDSGERRILADHAQQVDTARISPGGERVATVDSAGTVRVWDLDAMQASEVEGGSPIAFAPDGTLATATGRGDILLHQATPGEKPRSLVGRGVPVDCLAFSADGWLAAGDEEGGVRVWRLDDGTSRDLGAHDDAVRDLSFEGSLLTAASLDKSLSLWDLKSGVSRRLQGHGGGVGFWAVVPESGHVVTVGREGAVRQWEPLPEVPEHWLAHDGSTSVIAAGKADHVATGGRDGVVQELSGDRWRSPVTHDAEITALAYAPDGATLASGDAGGHVKLRDGAGSPREIGLLEGEVLDLAFTRGGDRIAVAEDGADVSLWSVATGDRAVLRTGDFQVAQLHPCDDGETLATAGWLRDKPQLQWLRLEDGAQVLSVPLHDDGLPAAAFSVDCQAAAVTTFSRGVMLWRAETGELVELGTHEGQVHGVAFSADGRTLATASDDGTARLWDIETGRNREIELTIEQPRAIAFLGDGDAFIAGGDDPSIFYGRDDVPHDPIRLADWIESATSVTADFARHD